MAGRCEMVLSGKRLSPVAGCYECGAEFLDQLNNCLFLMSGLFLFNSGERCEIYVGCLF
jgi:hypothetical protein